MAESPISTPNQIPEFEPTGKKKLDKKPIIIVTLIAFVFLLGFIVAAAIYNYLPEALK